VSHPVQKMAYSSAALVLFLSPYASLALQIEFSSFLEVLDVVADFVFSDCRPAASDPPVCSYPSLSFSQFEVAFARCYGHQDVFSPARVFSLSHPRCSQGSARRHRDLSGLSASAFSEFFRRCFCASYRSAKVETFLTPFPDTFYSHKSPRLFPHADPPSPSSVRWLRQPTFFAPMRFCPPDFVGGCAVSFYSDNFFFF